MGPPVSRKIQSRRGGQAFYEALTIDPNYAPAYLGLARVAAERYDKKAVELAHQALEHDPKLVEARELLAYLALEDSDAPLAEKEAQQALSLSNDSLDAMAVLATIDWLNDKPESDWMARILKINPVYGDAYATAATSLSSTGVIRRAFSSIAKRSP